MKLGETVTYTGLEGVFLCGSIPLQSACARLLWWESWIWHEHGSHLPPGCAGSYHLGGRWGRYGSTLARNRCELGLLLCSVSIPPYWGWGQVPRCWRRSLEGRVQTGFFPSMCAVSPLPAIALLPQRGAALKQEGLEWAPGVGRGACWDGPGMPVIVWDNS